LGQRIAAPTLILWGEKDVALGCEMARMSLEWCDDGRLIGFPTASHWVQHDESEVVNQHLLQFLGGVP
jgi:pimeloyl-ACP methyl ester carboxylesterase